MGSMKILVIAGEGEEKVINSIDPLLEGIKARVDILLVKSNDRMGGDIKRQFADFFNPAASEENDQSAVHNLTHVLVVSPIAQRWLDFLAGFSYGSHIPLLIYGDMAIEAIPVEFAAFFRSIKTETTLKDYLKAESEAFKKWKAASDIMEARNELLQLGIPVNGESLARCAGESGIREISLFLAAGFSPDTRNKTGVPLLNIAARKGNREILDLLIQANAQLNLQSDDRDTSALVDSVMAKHPDIMDDLIRAGADLDIKSKDGQTALVVAVGAGDERMVEALLKAGADPEITDSMGVSARKYASLFHKESITTLFETYAPKKI